MNPETPPAPGARTFRLIVEYDGCDYAGWQLQPEHRTVQGELEAALGRVLNHPVRLAASGRTDAGVHARGQVVRLETTHPTMPPRGILHGANNTLPPDVRVLRVEPCPPDFDPRRDARLRWYRYSMLERPVAPVIGRRYVTHLARPIDWPAIDDALQRLRGEHDFAAFRSSACTATRTRLTMRDARHVAAGPVHHFDLRCRSFLHHMVRMLAGLLIEIGEGRHEPGAVNEMLDAGRRTRSFRTAAPEGLTLMRVWYEGEDVDNDAEWRSLSGQEA